MECEHRFDGKQCADCRWRDRIEGLLTDIRDLLTPQPSVELAELPQDGGFVLPAGFVDAATRQALARGTSPYRAEEPVRKKPARRKPRG